MPAEEKKHNAEEMTNDQAAPAGGSKTNGETAAPSAAEAPASSPLAGAGPAAESPSPGMQEQLRQLQLEKKELWNQLVRRQADFENFRKRLEREVGEARQLAAASVIEELLPVVDALDRSLAVPVEGAAEEYRKGFDLIRKQFVDTLGRFGLKAIEAVGKPFDPHYHHAVERIETAEHPDHTVIAELQRGYTFRHKVLRPALVRVAVRPPAKTEDAAARDQEAGQDESGKRPSRLDIN